MELLCKFWALNESLQEFKAMQQSRQSSLSPHDWLEQEEEGEESESGEDEEEYYNDPEDELYIQPYRNGAEGGLAAQYRNGHGSSAGRLGAGAGQGASQPGSDSSLEYGDI